MIRKSELDAIRKAEDEKSKQEEHPIWKNKKIKLPICPKCGSVMMAPDNKVSEYYKKWYMCSNTTCNFLSHC